MDPGEMEAALQAGGVRGPGPPGGGKGGQWRRIDVKKMPQNVGDGLATTPSHVYAQSTVRIIVCCASITIPITITGIVFYCNYCFRRITHLVVKNHLHSSSGVREVVSSTVSSRAAFRNPFIWSLVVLI